MDSPYSSTYAGNRTGKTGTSRPLLSCSPPSPPAALSDLVRLLAYEENVSAWAQLTEYGRGLEFARARVQGTLSTLDTTSPLPELQSLVEDLRHEKRLCSHPSEQEYARGLVFALEHVISILDFLTH